MCHLPPPCDDEFWSDWARFMILIAFVDATPVPTILDMDAVDVTSAMLASVVPGFPVPTFSPRAEALAKLFGWPVNETPTRLLPLIKGVSFN